MDCDCSQALTTRGNQKCALWLFEIKRIKKMQEEQQKSYDGVSCNVSLKKEQDGVWGMDGYWAVKGRIAFLCNSKP